MPAEDAFRPHIPSTARMYDYYLDGKNNYPADREAAEKAIATMPPGTLRATARHNREFLGRVVRFAAGEANISQFLDIGTGLPIMNQVHEVARDVRPSCRVVYVDHDPVVLAHARDMLNGVPGTTIIKHDLRNPGRLLADPELRSLLDFDKPVAVLLIAILHFISDEEDPRQLIRTLTDPLPPGSYLAISHLTSDGHDGVSDGARAGYATATSHLYSRTRDEVAALFDGLDLTEPGVVWLPQWRPDATSGSPDKPADCIGWCGVARKP